MKHEIKMNFYSRIDLSIIHIYIYFGKLKDKIHQF